MTAKHFIPRAAYFHPDDPAGWLGPDEPLMVEGLDWSWAFVRYRLVDGYPDYSVGDNGLVWTRRRRNRLGSSTTFWRRMSPGWQESGHLHVELHNDNNKRKYTVHKLVASAFIGPRPDGQEIRHRNGNPTNNRSTNLLYGTRADNIRDAIEHGALAKGMRCGAAKFSYETIIRVRELRAAGLSCDRVAAMTGVCRAYAHAIGRMMFRKDA